MNLTRQPFTLSGLRDAYRAGATPEAVIAEVHARIARVDDPALFIHLRPLADAIADAAGFGEPAEDKPLWGIPFVIKDNIDAGGMPTTAACPAYAYTAEADAFAVARLRAAGAILIGKTNLDQFATGLVGVRSPYGVPRNALDPALVPGGSSSGSAVAVAHGIVPFSLGTDTAGSGRSPAALNNLVGLKPTLGAISASGVVPACRTLDTISVFALTVEDAWEAFSVAAAHDPADAYSRAVPLPALSAAPEGLRIGIPDAATIEFFGDSAQEASYRAALARLEAAGAEILPMDFTLFYDIARMLYEGVWVAERHTVIERMMAESPEDILPVIRTIVGKAETMSATDCFRAFYRMQELKQQAAARLAGIDLLCVPTIPTFFGLADLEADPIGPNSRLGTYTNFVNLLDLCGIAVPTGWREDGRPANVTLLAPAGHDALAASVALTFAAEGRRLGATGWTAPAATPPPARALPGEIEIAVCGAHMTGLPLNHQLTVPGGRFLRHADSAPDYAFYALPGGPPERPGMVKVGKGEGASIALEVWALPEAAVGPFLAGIPAPLGLGTVTLADGSVVKGFICEAAGAEGGLDISAYGGWRAWLADGRSRRAAAG
jgi:allophanate hydrolase